MNEPSIFTKIISGEIPSYKVYEDEQTLAFLDIMPDEEGHTLVVPKKQVDKIYDLDDDTYAHLWLVAKTIAKRYEEIFNRRIVFHVVGIDVPHAHIHIVPYDPANHTRHELHVKEKKQASSEDLAKLVEKLSFS